jgi:site-specific DNA-cytosine methylase
MGNADNYIQVVGNTNPCGHGQNGNIYDEDGISPCMTSSMKDYPEWNEKAGTRKPPLIGKDFKIRRLTPRECFRLMDFPDTFDFSVVSDSQAYKQAGNSIVVKMLELIISKFNILPLIHLSDRSSQ